MGQRIFPHDWMEACESMDCGQPSPKGEVEANYKKFLETGVPTRKNEEWKYTPAFDLLPEDWKIANAVGLDVKTFVPTTENTLVFLNGHYDASVSMLPEEVKVVQKNVPIAPAGAHGLSLFNFSFAATFVDVKITKSLKQPLFIILKNTTIDENEICLPNINVTLADCVTATIIEKFSSTCETTKGSTFAFVKYTLAKKSELKQIVVQAQSKGNNLIYQMRSDVSEGASLKSYLASVGGSLSRFDLQLALNEPHSDNELHGVYVANGEQHMDMHTHIDHKVPQCKSNQVYRGILSGKAQGVFNGKLFVHRDAQVTRAMQSNKNLLLSDEAIMNTKPELEIYADDVIAAHGATIGQLDKQALYYFQTRGLSEKEASIMLTLAFADEVLQNIPNEAVVAELKQLIRNKLS